MRNTIYSTPNYPHHQAPQHGVATAALKFSPVTLDAIPAMRQILVASGSRANDFTIGGLLMWTHYFSYQYCILHDTLFIKGVSEMCPSLPAFSLPVGQLPLGEAVGHIVDYCRANHLAVRFSAIPADRLDEVRMVVNGECVKLDDWSDYIYDIADLASLAGRRYNKKRNHVNRFMLENPEARLEPLSPTLVPEVAENYRHWISETSPDTPSEAEEMAQTLDVLDNFQAYPFEGAVLRLGDGSIAAFTMGEIIGDTLFVHIEKMRHTVVGAGETINKLFAAMMQERHPSLRYINREEDAGDPGLRQAKLSYHPAIILDKYDIIA